MTDRAAARGFTLIELLLAMGMVAMLMLSVYAGMSTAFRAKKSVIAQTAAMRQAKIALDLVEQDLRCILPPSGTFAGAFTGTPGNGSSGAATIDCYSLGSDYATLGQPNSDGIRHVTIMTLPDAQTNTLVRDVTRDLMAGSLEEEVLASNISGFSVLYYDGSTWTDTWDSTQQNNSLPLAADVTVEIKQPTETDPQHIYKMSRMITLPCGLTPDQAAAVAAAANGTTDGTGTTPSDGSTPTPTAGGTQ